MTVSITDVGVSMTMMKISAPTAATSVSASPMPLTFGLEFEHVLLFHSSLLLPHLAPGTQIKKALPHVTRLALRQTTSQYQLSRPIYNGWGLSSPTDYTSPFGDGWHNDCLEQYGVRGYADEILRVEKMILEKGMGKGSNVAVHDGRGKMKNFENWHLVTDTSLVGATPEELSSLLAATTITTTTPSNDTDTDTDTHIGIDLEEWDSSPVELVSRVLPLDSYNAEASFHEINTMLTHLLGSNDTLHRAFTDQHCGLHIHIGIPTGFSLPLLQHLAYILTIYEPVLSSLHPAWRRPGHKGAEVDLRGNREAFYEEPDFSAVDWESWDLEMEIDGWGRDSGYASREDDDDVDDGVVLDFPFPKDGEGREWDGDGYVGVVDDDERFELGIQRKAREVIFAGDMTVEALCGVMGGVEKGRVVNWLCLKREEREGPRTVEFRQHEGCLDGGEVRVWVEFCAGLVRWAGTMAERWEEGGKDAGGEWFDGVYGRGSLGVEELVEGMGLGEEGRGWVRRRVEMWKKEDV